SRAQLMALATVIDVPNTRPAPVGALSPVRAALPSMVAQAKAAAPLSFWHWLCSNCFSSACAPASPSTTIGSSVTTAGFPAGGGAQLVGVGAQAGGALTWALGS